MNIHLNFLDVILEPSSLLLIFFLENLFFLCFLTTLCGIDKVEEETKEEEE